MRSNDSSHAERHHALAASDQSAIAISLGMRGNGAPPLRFISLSAEKKNPPVSEPAGEGPEITAGLVAAVWIVVRRPCQREPKVTAADRVQHMHGSRIPRGTRLSQAYSNVAGHPGHSRPRPHNGDRIHRPARCTDHLRHRSRTLPDTRRSLANSSAAGQLAVLMLPRPRMRRSRHRARRL